MVFGYDIPNKRLALTGAFLSALAHAIVHGLFIKTSQFVEVGVWWATLAIFIVVYLGIVLTTAALRESGTIDAVLVATASWLTLFPIGHDGTHAVFVPVSKILSFGDLGIPESGITFSLIAAGFLIAVFYTE